MKQTFFKSMIAAVTAAIMATGVAAAETLEAPEPYMTQLTEQMVQYSQQYMGGKQLSAALTGALPQGGKDRLTIELDSGGQFSFLAVCDSDCSDIDLRVYDPSGALVGEDVLLDDYPVVSFTAARSATYVVEVIMATCRQAPCYYAVGTFE